MPTKSYLDKAFAEFESALEHLKKELSKLQIGRASPSLLEDLHVDVYGSSQPLKAVASVSPLDVHTLQVQPWDRNVLADVERGIRIANLNLNPVNDGKVLRITLPPLTEERRKELASFAHKLGEDCRISVRRGRQTAHDTFKELEKNKEISEDEQHIAEKHLQQHVDEANKQIEELVKKKEEEIMKI